jgi:hypothetical protein
MFILLYMVKELLVLGFLHVIGLSIGENPFLE